MKSVLKHFEMIQNIFKGILLRETLKKNKVELNIYAFEQERLDKTLKGQSKGLPEDLCIDQSKEFRRSHNIVESTFVPSTIEVLPIPPPLLERLESDKPIKRQRPEAQVMKKKELSHEIARACCLLIAEGEKSQKWPFIDSNSRSSNEMKLNNVGNQQPSHERSLKMRGRISRCGKRIVIDRFSNNEFQHRWGRYLGLHGVWHSFDGEGMQDEYENDDMEALIRVQKMILQGFRPNSNKIKK